MSGAKGHGTGRLASVKEKALEEFKLFWIIALYLWLLFGAFMVYRRLVLAEFGVTYLNIGFAVVQALIIGKVILIGDAFKIARHFEDGPLAYSVLWKALIFSLFVMAFGVLEHVVEGLYHEENLREIAVRMMGIGKLELAARTLMLIAAFVPFFAFWELGRVVGREKLTGLFFSRRKAAPEAERSA
jgi:hypothetical protein